MKTESLLVYDAPAENFDEAIPVGNGRLGGMIFGSPVDEVIKLNEDSVWSGGLRNRVNPNAKEGFKEVRELIFQERIPEAEQTASEKLQGVSPDMRHYMPLCDLNIHMELGGKAREYSRHLDISEAVSDVEFRVNGVLFRREVFVSAPDNVLAVRVWCEEGGSIDLDCCIDGRDDFYDDNRPCSENALMYTGGTGSKTGILFAVCAGAYAVGGTLRTLGGKLRVRDADEVVIVLSARTSFYMKNYKNTAKRDVEKAIKAGWEKLFARHTKDYKNLFDRVRLNLNDNSGVDTSAMTTAERIVRLRGDELNSKDCERLIHDNKLIELFFNFSRYLMISASRPGTQPMNLQGIWNADPEPIWGSRYTVNVNTQMNYWTAESCNLSECHLPLFDLLERVCENGKKVAKEMYGIERGFVCHHNTDIWGDCAPQDWWTPATIWCMGGAWLALHIFEHYEYTMDRDFLAEKYHILKESAEFFTEYLVEDSEGRLVTCPSVSPENTYLTENGVKGSLCAGPSMDSQIITVLFRDVIKSTEILGIDEDFAEELKKMLEKLPSPEIGKYGQIKEWAVDYDEVEVGHRHISQLFALFPADLISPEKTPKLADASRATLVRRLIHGGNHKGWSCAWIANMWARLYDGRMVYENIKRLLLSSTNPNMLCTHPPFQIDANFGGASAIVESLMQSHSGEINILPALPDTWNSGSVSGLKAKGGFEVSIEWQDGKLTAANIVSHMGRECRVRTNTVASILCDGERVDSMIEDGAIIFSTTAGKRYTIKP